MQEPVYTENMWGFMKFPRECGGWTFPVMGGGKITTYSAANFAPLFHR